MSKLSKLVSGKNIIAGEQIISTILTKNITGNAGALLQEIAKKSDGSRIKRDFSQDWQQEGDILINRGSVEFLGRNFPLTLKIGTEDIGDSHLLLQDASGNFCSMCPKNESMILQIGSEISAIRLKSLASQVVGSWIVHGKNWRDRVNIQFHRPWGAERKGIPEKFFFEIIDGSFQRPRPTLDELVKVNCWRSTHVGEWFQRQSTIIPALIEMNMTMHEFKREGGDDICMFNGLPIGKNPNVWGPYCQWNELVRHSGNLGIWHSLAMSCACPFNFHVHATRTLFPKIQLDSDYLLQVIGQQKLEGMLEVMVVNQPERFYRIIDEKGLTHRLTGVSQNTLQYGDFGVFERSQIVDNVIETLKQLQLIQYNPCHTLSRVNRIVIDSHAYLVIESMSRSKNVVYELSGRHMHKYLTDGSDAKMHRARNEALFLLLRNFFGLRSMKFHIYPPLTHHTGLKSQYDENVKHNQRDQWLAKEVK